MSSIATARLITRIVGILAVSLLLWLYAKAVRAATWRHPKTRYRLICHGMSGYTRAVAWIIGMRIRVRGTPPKAPFILVTNHISFTDILLLCATTPAWFISNSKVAKWPVFGPLTRNTNTLFIDREIRREVQRMNAQVTELVQQGGGIVFFPEGGTSDGTAVRPFKPSLLQPAIDLAIPVHYAAISYTTAPGSPPAGELIPWSGEIDFGSHAKKLLATPGFTAHVHFSGQTIQAGDRKELALRTHAAVADLHQQLKQAGEDQ